MVRLINTNKGKVDRIIIITDADGRDLAKEESRISRFLKINNDVKIVLLDHEIEEWICYANDKSFGDQKPSDFLKDHYGYQKNKLPTYAEKLDCEKMKKCPSFMRFMSSLYTSA